MACGHLMTGHMVVVSRAFSQFYFHCRVLPGSSGFDGSFEEQAFFSIKYLVDGHVRMPTGNCGRFGGNNQWIKQA